MDTKEGMPPHLKEAMSSLLDGMIEKMAEVIGGDHSTEEEFKVALEAVEVAAKGMELKRELHNL